MNDTGHIQGADGVRFSALAIDAIRLAVPMADVRTLEAAADVDRDAAPPRAVGWLNRAGRRIPVYNADARLLPAQQPDPKRRICVVLAGSRGDFGLLCDEFYPVAQPQPPHTVPRAARVPGTPVRGVFEHEQRLYCVSSSATLAAYFGVAQDEAGGQ